MRTHRLRLYRFRGRLVVALAVEPSCWWVRFVEFGKLQHTALIDPTEVQATPFVFVAVQT